MDFVFPPLIPVWVGIGQDDEKTYQDVVDTAVLNMNIALRFLKKQPLPDYVGADILSSFAKFVAHNYLNGDFKDQYEVMRQLADEAHQMITQHDSPANIAHIVEEMKKFAVMHSTLSHAQKLAYNPWAHGLQGIANYRIGTN